MRGAMHAAAAPIEIFRPDLDHPSARKEAFQDSLCLRVLAAGAFGAAWPPIRFFEDDAVRNDEVNIAARKNNPDELAGLRAAKVPPPP